MLHLWRNLFLCVCIQRKSKIWLMAQVTFDAWDVVDPIFPVLDLSGCSNCVWCSNHLYAAINLNNNNVVIKVENHNESW